MVGSEGDGVTGVRSGERETNGQWGRRKGGEVLL